eukprot:SAG31_NODE_230_length_19771_cov_90.041739_7_plen_69_part_00
MSKYTSFFPCDPAALQLTVAVRPERMRLRMASELEKGSIVIDGIDIATMGLKQLRTAIAMLPQDPVRS